MAQFIMLVGLSGSGKSTYAEKLAKEEYEVLSSDVLRAELFGDENDQTHNNKVFNELHKRIMRALKEGKNCCYDATNLSSKRRVAFLKQIAHIKCEKICCVFRTPIYACIEQDKMRARNVGEKVIWRQAKQFQMPFEWEGWDAITIMKSSYRIDDINFYSEKFKDISHDCPPYHYESVWTHMRICEKLAESAKEDKKFIFALSIHDIGKFLVKDFHNSKGDITEIAHYYGHENIGAYLYLESPFMDKEVLALIQYHMMPYKLNWEKWKQGKPQWLIEGLEKINCYDKLGRKTKP